MDKVKSLLINIHSITIGAKIIHVGYPKFFPVQGHSGCNGIDVGKQLLLNRTVDRVDDALAQNAKQYPYVKFVDVRALFTTHEICGSSAKMYINDLQQNLKTGQPNCPSDYIVNGVCSQSFHPNTLAYAAEKDLLWPIVKQELGIR